MIEKKCKTCLFHFQPNGMCFAQFSAFRNMVTDREDSCSSWTSHVCDFCGGTMEERHGDGKYWWHCYACHSEYEGGE